MIIDKYLYEIIDDYKNAEQKEEKTEIFEDFCSSIWSCKNKRRTYVKTIRFKVRDDLLESEIGNVFNMWSEVEYIGYKSMSKDADWCNLIRQKINNLYTRYFDKEVILNKDYMKLLRTPKRLYFRWVNGEKMNVDELTDVIDSAIYDAGKLKIEYQKQKIDLSWSDYKIEVEKIFKKIFKNCKLIEYFEVNNKLLNIYDLSSEDNFYVSYVCTYLENEMKQFQKKYYEVRNGKRYKRCKECGDLFEIKNKKDFSARYCSNCKDNVIREQTRIRVKNHRNKKCNAS